MRLLTVKRLFEHLRRLVSFFCNSACVDGLNFNLRGMPMPLKKRRHLRRGDYEMPERVLISKFIKPGMHVLEVGASLGIISTVIARQIGPSGRLLSVEADVSIMPFWKRNLADNQLQGACVTALVSPTWGRDVPASLLEKTFRPSEDKLSGRFESSSAGGVQVPWKTARMICEENNFTPTAFIVDIEGSEKVWTEGPVNLPASIEVLVVEFHPQYTGPEIAAGCVQAILDDGFRLAGYINNVLAFSRR